MAHANRPPLVEEVLSSPRILPWIFRFLSPAGRSDLCKQWTSICTATVVGMLPVFSQSSTPPPASTAPEARPMEAEETSVQAPIAPPEKELAAFDIYAVHAIRMLQSTLVSRSNAIAAQQLHLRRPAPETLSCSLGLVSACRALFCSSKMHSTVAPPVPSGPSLRQAQTPGI